MSIEDDILIENYLRGLLTKDEELKFFDKLKTDESFYKMFVVEKQLFETLNDDRWSFSEGHTDEIKAYEEILESKEIQSLKKTLVKTNSEFKEKGAKKRDKRLFYYLAAASILLFVAFSFFLNESPTNQELYNDYVALNDLPSFVSRSETSNKLAKGQELFESQNYKESLSIFKSAANTEEVSGNVLIYKGLSEIELGLYDNAQATFDSLINSDLFDAQIGYWYKALLFLKQDRVEDAKQILNKIVSDNLYKNKEASKLLKDLR